MFLKYCLYKTTVSQIPSIYARANKPQIKGGSKAEAGKRKLGGSGSACDQPEVMKGNLQHLLCDLQV